MCFFRRYGIWLFLLLGFSSCKSFEEVKVSSIDNFKVKEISMKGIEAELTVTIDNPNALAFKVYPSSAELKYGNVALGKARIVKKVRIPAHSKKQHTFILKGDLKNVGVGDIATMMGGRGGKKLELDGYLKAGRFILKIPRGSASGCG